MGWGSLLHPRPRMERAWGLGPGAPSPFTLTARGRNRAGRPALLLQRWEAPRGKGLPWLQSREMMADWALLLHPPSPGPSSLAPVPRKGGTHRKGSPVLLGISGEERGRCWPFPSQGHLAGGAGGRGDKGADVGDASTLIMEDGPTHTADLDQTAH